MNVIFLSAIPAGKHVWRPSSLGQKDNTTLLGKIKNFARQDNIYFSKYSIKSWQSWAKSKENVHVFVHKKPWHNANKIPPPWQRWQCLEVLNKNGIFPEKIMIVDADTMVHWDCPNIFEMPTAEGISVCRDDGNKEWVNKSIQNYQDIFPETALNSDDYFNSGVVLLGQKSFPTITALFDFYRENQARLNDKSKADLGIDQTAINFFCRQNKVPITFMDERYNYQQPGQKGTLNDLSFIDKGYIWHFNGIPWRSRTEHMRNLWRKIAKNYEQ